MRITRFLNERGKEHPGGQTLRCMVALVPLVVVVSAARGAGGAEGEAAEVRLDLDLRLYGALVVGDPADERGAGPETRTLILHLRKAGDQWEPVIGYGGGGSKAPHHGWVTESASEGGRLRLGLDVTMGRDEWTPGFQATYRVGLARDQGRGYLGRFAGICRGVRVEGEARASAFRSRPTAPGYVPVRPGEHPRILFRRHDLPALRKKAATEFGKAALAAMEGPVGLGVKYQLTGGDPAHAREAMAPVWDLMGRTIYHSNHGGSGLYAEQVALAYDLCYDAWPAPFKRRVENYLARMIDCAFHAQRFFLTSRINWHACSNYAGPIYTGCGFGGLAIWGEKGPEPARPEAPEAVVELAPAADYRQARGVPVVALEPGKCPGRWLMSDPVMQWMREDPLADLGRAEACRPAPGTKYPTGRGDSVFAPVDEALVRDDGAVDMAKRLGNPTHGEATVCFYTVLECGGPALVKVHAPPEGFARPQAVLAGRTLGHGQIVRLGAGRYPLLVVWRSSSKGTAPAFPPMGVRLDPATEDDVRAAEAALPERRAAHERALLEWQREVAEWKRLDGCDVEYMRRFREGCLGVYLHYREGIGTGGFQAEVGNYSSNASGPPLRFAAAYRTMFGEDLSPHADATHYLPRKMFGHVYRPDGKPLAQDINGTPGVGPENFAAAFPVVPDAWRPAVLWAWRYHAGPDDTIAADPMLGRRGKLGRDPVRTFLHYPLEQAPQPPQGIMPLTWQAPDFGYYGFRDGWRGEDDFLAQVFLKAHPVFGWNAPNGGTFRLIGLGHVWAHGPTARERCRWAENVVMLPEDRINEGGCARLTHVEARADGSGVVAMDMSEIYAAEVRGRTYEYYGGKRLHEMLKDSGIRGLRSVAVDYSGASGAPCLLVIADRITGGGSKVWVWQLGGATGGKGRRADPDAHLPHTTVDRDPPGFTIRKPDGAVLRATFVAPVKAVVEAEARKVTFYNSHSGDMERTLPAAFARGADPKDGDFLVVVTVGRGVPPAVKVEGTGLGAAVTVGRQVVRFDGAKLTLGR